MRAKTFKFTVVGLFLLALTLIAQSAKASSISMIDEIDIPITSATYNGDNGDFTISGRPTSDVTVFYNDGGQQTFDFTLFSFSTIGLGSEVLNNGSKIEYTSSSSYGNISLVDGNNFSPILVGDLVSLSMEIINPSLGAFQGSGAFNVTGGALADYFGENGSLATIGICFTVPADFNSSFAALANTSLFPEPSASSASIPDPASVLFLGSAMLVAGLAGLGRKTCT